jgi:hypothetical protein
MKSIGKSFESLGKLINKTGKTISRWLKLPEEYYEVLIKLAQKEFTSEKELYLIFDDTVIRKTYSQLIEGTAGVYDTKLFRRIMGYKLLATMITDGKKALPLWANFFFSKELAPNDKERKSEWIKRVIIKVKELFSDKRIIVLADGAFASKEFLGWCHENKIDIEVRMRSNCSVTYKEKKVKIRDIKELRPKGRQMARTISVIWHDIPLFITADRRIDKHGNESIVFQASTFEAKPSRHVQIYKIRWNIEKMFRTIKKDLGLQECSARKIELQEGHVASVLLAYAFLQHDNLPTPEDALRAVKRKSDRAFDCYIDRLNKLIA